MSANAMGWILCDTTPDFDALRDKAGLPCLQPEAKIVLARVCYPAVRDFSGFDLAEIFNLPERASFARTMANFLIDF